MFAPHEAPDTGAAAQALVEQLQRLSDQSERSAYLANLCATLGDTWYPIFVKLLGVTGETGPVEAKVVLADAVAQAMQHGQTPGGALSAWGVPPQISSFANQLGAGFFRMPSRRALDPITYTCAWFSQATSRQLLPREVFEPTIQALISLFSASPPAAAIYQAKLQADLTNLAEGTLSKATRLRLTRLLELWRSGTSPIDISSEIAGTELPTLSATQAVNPWLRMKP